MFRIALAYLAGAWLLIQIVETLFPVFGLGDGSIRIVVILLAIGFLPAIALAWVFEWTPGGPVLDDGSGAPKTAAQRRRFDQVVIATLAVAVALFALHTFVFDPARDEGRIEEATQAARIDAIKDSFGDKSIAVLPFVNLSADPEQDYMGDGLAEELLNLLADVPALRVTSRTSAFQFKGSDAGIPEIAERLGVAYVLEGSVRRAGDQIRITAQLIDARVDAHVWSQTYDRVIDDIFAIQDDVAAHVTAQLRVVMQTESPAAKRHDTTAYTQYLRARHLFNTGNHERFEEAVDLVEQALNREPEFVEAFVLRIWLFQELSMEHDVAKDLRIAYQERTQTLAAEAAERWPDHAEVNASLAWFRGIVIGDLQAAADHVERALELDARNVYALNLANLVLLSLDRTTEALRVGAWTTRVDPLELWAHVHYGMALESEGRVDRAVEEYRIAAELRPDDMHIQFKYALALLRSGQPEATLRQLERVVDDPNYYHMGRSAALYDLGRPLESDQALEQLYDSLADIQREIPDFNWDSGLARLHAWRREPDLVLALFAPLRDSPQELIAAATDPMYRRIANDPRWISLVEKAQQEMETIRFDPVLPPVVSP